MYTKIDLRKIDTLARFETPPDTVLRLIWLINKLRILAARAFLYCYNKKKLFLILALQSYFYFSFYWFFFDICMLPWTFLFIRNSGRNLLFYFSWNHFSQANLYYLNGNMCSCVPICFIPFITISSSAISLINVL